MHTRYSPVMILMFCLILVASKARAQGPAMIYGRITAEDGTPIFPASIALPGSAYGTVTDENGRYVLELPSGPEIRVVISFLGYRQEEMILDLQPGQRLEINKKLRVSPQDLEEITIREENARTTTLSRIDIKTLDMLPTVSGNVESILSTMPGVSSRSELSSQYSVRGGNFDENLVYVNDIEIHRPFLIRSGQQEGLSFINPDLVSSIQFSAGGFEAKYGDKMSSVLDIKYRRPAGFAGSAGISLLGGSLHLEGASNDQRFTYISGLRYRTTRYLLSSLETTGEYNPDFLDFQTLVTCRVTDDWELSLLGNIAYNRFHFIPATRKTDFGTYNNPLNLKIFYGGQERDRFDSYTGALTLHYNPRESLSLKFIGSAFSSVEQERFDIRGEYLVNELDNEIGSETYGDSILNIGIGAMHDHARNYLDAFVYSFSHKGTQILGANTLRWGFRWQHERIHDQLSEWELIDSVGYSLPYNGEEVGLFRVLKSDNQLFSNRIHAYIQNTYSFRQGNIRYYVNGGLRAAWWDMNNEWLFSPRLTFSMKPSWQRDIVFRLTGGYYFQPPFYKELRYPDGNLNRDVSAQRSIHFVGGADMHFTAWERPFKFTAEVYYKHLDRLIPYKLDNVRIQYAAENLARGYAAGIDLKIHGEFVPGATSWASLSLMKTEADILTDAYGPYPRPTDQRLMVGVYFRDYFPNNPDYKVLLNLIYGSGLPFSPPHTDRYDQVFRMPAYKRVDLGFSKVLKREDTRLNEKNPFRHLRSIWVSAEIFNLLDVKNTVSYQWIKTVSNQQNVPGAFAVPNYLTGRRFNIRLTTLF